MPIVRTDTKRASALPAPRRAAPAEPARAPGVGAWPIWAGGAAVTAAVGWFAFNLPGPRGPAALGWLPALFAMAVAAVGCWATAGTPGLSRGAVRFWRQMALVAGFSAVGLAIRAVYIVPLGAGPHAASYLPMATMLFTHTAVVLGVWALLRVPV
ncbi:MAG TPA: hypothetical protein VFT95_09180, partial [Micromonosporaceae bacterium]|nr:hypothetical protein [Micromonosporaceae bacterium]